MTCADSAVEQELTTTSKQIDSIQLDEQQNSQRWIASKSQPVSGLAPPPKVKCFKAPNVTVSDCAASSLRPGCAKHPESLLIQERRAAARTARAVLQPTQQCCVDNALTCAVLQEQHESVSCSPTAAGE